MLEIAKHGDIVSDGIIIHNHVLLVSIILVGINHSTFLINRFCSSLYVINMFVRHRRKTTNYKAHLKKFGE